MIYAPQRLLHTSGVKARYVLRLAAVCPQRHTFSYLYCVYDLASCLSHSNRSRLDDTPWAHGVCAIALIISELLKYTVKVNLAYLRRGRSPDCFEWSNFIDSFTSYCDALFFFPKMDVTCLYIFTFDEASLLLAYGSGVLRLLDVKTSWRERGQILHAV